MKTVPALHINDVNCQRCTALVDADGNVYTATGEPLMPTGKQEPVLGWGKIDGVRPIYRTAGGVEVAIGINA